MLRRIGGVMEDNIINDWRYKYHSTNNSGRYRYSVTCTLCGKESEAKPMLRGIKNVKHRCCTPNPKRSLVVGESLRGFTLIDDYTYRCDRCGLERRRDKKVARKVLINAEKGCCDWCDSIDNGEKIVNNWVVSETSDRSKSGGKLFSCKCRFCNSQKPGSRTIHSTRKLKHVCCCEKTIIKIKNDVDGTIVNDVLIIKKLDSDGYGVYKCIRCGKVTRVKGGFRRSQALRYKHKCCTTLDRMKINGYLIEYSHSTGINEKHSSRGIPYNRYYTATCLNTGIRLNNFYNVGTIKKLKHECCTSTEPFSLRGSDGENYIYNCDCCGYKMLVHKLGTVKMRCKKCNAVGIDRLAKFKTSNMLLVKDDLIGTIFENEEFVKLTIVSKLVEEKGLNKAINLIKLKVD